MVNTSARGSVSQFGEVKVKPLSVPASMGWAWAQGGREELVPHLGGEGLDEGPLPAQLETVEADEPVRGGHHLGHGGHQAVVAVHKHVGGGVAHSLQDGRGEDGVKEGVVVRLLVQNLRSKQ